MLRKIFIYLTLSAAAIFGGCKSASQSRITANTAIAECESIDLRKYRATEYEMARYREELGGTYADVLKEMQIGRDMRGEISNHYLLSEEEQVSISHYTGIGFAHVNPALNNSDLKAIAKNEMFIKVLISALNKMPSFEGIAYRVGNLPDFQAVTVAKRGQDPNKIDPERLAKLKVGEAMNFKRFLSSTSFNFDRLAELGWKCSEAKYTINSKYGREITSFAKSAQEGEILFVPGSKFIIKALKVTTPPANGCTKEVVHVVLDEI